VARGAERISQPIDAGALAMEHLEQIEFARVVRLLDEAESMSR